MDTLKVIFKLPFCLPPASGAQPNRERQNYMYRKLIKSSLIILLLIGARCAVLAQTVFTPGWLKEDYFTPISGGVDGLVG